MNFVNCQVLNHTLTVKRQGEATLLIRSTIPFASETIETPDGQQNTSPLNVQLSFPNNNTKCKEQLSGNLKSCEIKLKSFTHGDRHKYDNPTNWNEVNRIEISNSDDEKYNLEDHKLVLRLTTNVASGRGAQIFSNANLHDVHVRSICIV